MILLHSSLREPRYESLASRTLVLLQFGTCDTSHIVLNRHREAVCTTIVLKIAMSGNHGVIGEIKETIFHLGSLVPRTVLIYLIWKKEKKKEGKEKIYLSMNPTISPCHDVTNSKGYSVENTLVTVLYLQNIFSRTLFMHRISYT